MAESINKTLKDDVESARMKKKEGDPRKWQPEAVPREIPIHRRQSKFRETDRQIDRGGPTRDNNSVDISNSHIKNGFSFSPT